MCSTLVDDVDLNTALKIVERRPVRFRVKKDLLPMIDAVLRKRLILYEVESVGDEVVVFAAYPDKLLNLHRNIAEKSWLLSEPIVVEYALRHGTVVETGEVRRGLDLVRIVKTVCAEGQIIFVIRNAVGRALLACVHDKVTAAVFDAGTLHVGVEALRYTFFFMPAAYIALRVSVSELREP